MIIALWSACGSREPEVRVDRAESIQVEWLGHNCFLITSTLGLRIATDPFDPSVLNYPTPDNLRSDVLLVSHEDSTVNYTDLVVNAPQTFRSSAGVGSNQAGGIRFRGVGTHANPLQPTISGMNTVYHWTMDGVRFCFLGGIQRALSEDARREIGEVDVLFLPVGSPYQLSDSERDTLIGQLNPKIIIPMGYSTRHSQHLELGRLEAWLAGKPNVVRLERNRFQIQPDNLPERQTIMVPALPRG